MFKLSDFIVILGFLLVTLCLICLFVKAALYLLCMIKVVNFSFHEITLGIVLLPLAIDFVFFSQGVLASLIAAFVLFSFCYFFIAKDIKYIKRMFVLGTIITLLGFTL